MPYDPAESEENRLGFEFWRSGLFAADRKISIDQSLGTCIARRSLGFVVAWASKPEQRKGGS
jgi:hypothetical protein